jgi:hypothetical protein
MGESCVWWALVSTRLLTFPSDFADYQNRAGNKGAGVAGSSEANVDRRERLRKLALDTIDINKVSRCSPVLFKTPLL